MSFTPFAADEVFSRQAMNERLGQMDIPAGIICMWSGAADAIPTGWALCDGTSGTPDLRGRFVLGAGGSYDVGAKGGEEKHTLNTNEMPEHRHGMYKYQTGQDHVTATCISFNDVTYKNTASTLNEGGSKPHNNMPPYYALCYIMKL